MENMYQYGFLTSLVVIFGLVYYVIKLKYSFAVLSKRKDKLVKEAYFHPVTNLPNRTNIQYIFDEQIGRTLRHNKSFTVLAIKINNYHQVRETSTDLANRFMYEASDVIIKSTREEDMASHVDDDIFIVLFNEYLEGDQYYIVIDRLKKNFQKHKSKSINIAYDVSMGVSMYPIDGTDSTTLLEKAIEEAKSKQF